VNFGAAFVDGCSPDVRDEGDLGLMENGDVELRAIHEEIREKKNIE
jgi:hypothetical protein